MIRFDPERHDIYEEKRVRQRFFYGCIGYESGLFVAVLIQLLTGLPFSLLNSLGPFGAIASLAIAEYKGNAPTLAEVYRPLSLIGSGWPGEAALDQRVRSGSA
jgi:hypothetical protein